MIEGYCITHYSIRQTWNRRMVTCLSCGWEGVGSIEDYPAKKRVLSQLSRIFVKECENCRKQ